MWQLVKAEFKYYRVLFAVPMIFVIWFQIVEYYFIKSFQNESLSIGIGYLYMISGFFIFSILQKRFTEKREKFLAILPLSSKQLALSRFWFVVIPFAILTVYFVISHLIVNNLWHIELSIPIVHIGFLLIIVAGFVRARDDWFSHWNFGKRTQAAFISVSIIQIIVVAIFLGLPNSYNNSDLGLNNYAVLIFFLLGLVIMLTTIYSFQKRKSYLG